MERLEGNYLLSIYHHVATIVLYRREKDPQPLINLLQLLPIIYIACKPFVVATYRLHCLQTLCDSCLLFTLLSNLWLLLTVCSAFKPFMSIAYHLQQCYFPFKPQIACLSFCCCLQVVVNVLWQMVFPFQKTTI